MCLCFSGFGNRKKPEVVLCNWDDVSADTKSSVWGRVEAAVCQRAGLSAVAQCKCSISTHGGTGMLRKKGVFLAAARWDRTGATQNWCHGQGLLLTICSVAKEPWNLNKHMKCSQNPFCQ